MTYVPVHCPDCQGVDVVRYGKQRHGPQRYRCNNPDCPRHIFLLHYQNQGRLPAVDPAQHTVGKQHTQKIERKHTTLRARIKRLVRKTICFSKSIQMHDLVIGLFINRFAYGRAV